MNSLVDFWKRFDGSRELGSGLFFHDSDNDFIEKNPRLFDCQIYSPQTFIDSEKFGKFKDTDFHLSLLPVPYLGDLERADIFILLLNPGLGLTEYEDDADDELRQSLRANLAQTFCDMDFPFCKLNPAFSRTAGFQYWESKLRGVALKYAAECGISYREPLRKISSRLACIQLVPYHSAKFVGGPKVQNLPSSLAAVRYVQAELKPRAERGDALIVVTRQTERWGLEERDNAIVTYRGAECLNAPLTPSSRGGRLILERLVKWKRVA